ncbi:MAG: bifunctional aconitate hydratase 2/2-methylisocitrate dehydratase, partial [Deltaproteobacteria bacterium]|nr:bifunctional aconitate hydratase 2/2-methylisocitrate dehydratase [Deltaproteobacteria bacterium]
GYNIEPLIKLLDQEETAKAAADALSGTLLVFDAFDRVLELSGSNVYAKQAINSWAQADWFTKKPALPDKVTLTAFRVEGEINTDDFSPASEAWSRPDIPLHAKTMLKHRIKAPLEIIKELKSKGYPLVFVGDVVGTGSSRKSAANSLIWHIGKDIPYVPNKRQGGFVLGGKIAPIFFNTLEDAGALPVECDIGEINNGDVITIFPYEGKIANTETNKTISEFTLKSKVLLDEVRAGGRIPLIIGRRLTEKTCEALGKKMPPVFQRPDSAPDTGKGFTLAQKIVGRACGTEGVRSGTYCEPTMATVGSQDTTGPMTRDELNELACLKFSAGLVMQSFCHTAAYPKPVDIKMHKTLPKFFTSREGVSLKPGDGVIHSWLNRMILPDTVGTGGDSHTRFPLGISFPAGSGLVAFGAAMGMIPLDMPESVLVRFQGRLKPGITLRDLVNAIPYTAIQQGLLTKKKEGKKNIFSGRILEMEGLPDLSVDQAFELTDASAERSAAAAVIQLNRESVVEHMKSNRFFLEQLVSEGYKDRDTIKKRIQKIEEWISSPELLERDNDAEYIQIVDINLNEIKEPILACPNDPDDVRLLSEVSGTKIDEVFIGSCMTSIGHFRAAGKLLEGKTDLPVRLWMTPPTRMDQEQLRKEGYYGILEKAGARMEMPGCSLCMGNQARVAGNATVMSTSTRNFPNRMGDNANAFLGSAELAAICAIEGKMPDLKTYMNYVNGGCYE